MLQAESLTVGYSLRNTVYPVFENISFSLTPGEVVCLLGPNGCGKSTLLRTLSGLQKPLEGKVILNSRPLNDYSPGELASILAVVLTESIEEPYLKVKDLLSISRYRDTGWIGRLRAKDKAVIESACEKMGVQSLMEKYLGELSDGQRQKVMITRALVQEPSTIFLDEPTSFLDVPHKLEVFSLLKKLAREENRLILLSTHDLNIALQEADRLLLYAGEKFLCGSPADLAMDGSLAKAFSRDGVEFDANTGQFRLTGLESTTISLLGKDEGSCYWTKIALQREGFRVKEQTDSALISIKISGIRPNFVWQLTTNGESGVYYSLAELIVKLKKLRTSMNAKEEKH